SLDGTSSSPPWLTDARRKDLRVELTEAQAALELLLTEIDAQAKARGVRVSERPRHPPGWTPRERFAPPLHLVRPETGQRPTLGTEHVGRSPAVQARLRVEVEATLPDTLKVWQRPHGGLLGGRHVLRPEVARA